jgi:predicted RNA-binding protein with PIN domain
MTGGLGGLFVIHGNGIAAAIFSFVRIQQNSGAYGKLNSAMPYWFDGNNLIGQSAALSKRDQSVRRAFLSTLSSYHKSRGGKFLVYFDGDDPENSVSPTGVGIRYSAPLSTDEAILRRLHEIQHPSEIIVVTNDRDLKSRCRNAGATTLSWNEFDSRMKLPSRLRRENDREDRINIEDWIKYFGLDKTKI